MSHRATEHLPLTSYCTRKVFGSEGQTILRGGSKKLSPDDPGAHSQLCPGLQGDSAPSPVVSITSNGETRSTSPFMSSKASLGSEPRYCHRTIPSIALFKHSNDSKPLPGEKPPRSQPPSFHPSLFLVQLGLSQEGVGQIPPRACGVCESAVIALCDGAGFAGGGGTRLRSLQPSALRVLCITPGCWLPSTDSFTSLLGMWKGLV